MPHTFPCHYEEVIHLSASAETVFAFVDDHRNLASHMNENSMMMMGSSMNTHLDEENGRKVGSHIKMDGKVMGIPIALDEVVIERKPPIRKTWETVGTPKLLVVGNYRMGIEVTPHEANSMLKVFIDYELPTGATWLLGILFGSIYAKWCVRQMSDGVKKQFTK